MNTKGPLLLSGHGKYIQMPAVILGMAAVLVMFFAGCVTVGRDFPVSGVSEIEIGKTTRNEIRVMFGPPWRTGIEDGQHTWTYGNYSYGPFGEKKAKDLVIRFDERDVVASYTFSTTEHNE